MDYSNVKPSPVKTGADFLAKVSMIHGGMHQYMSGDKDLGLLISAAERFNELGTHSSAVHDCTPEQWKEASKKLKYIQASMVKSRRELESVGLLNSAP